MSSAPNIPPALDGVGHRVPQDWHVESAKDISRADGTIQRTFKERGASHLQMKRGEQTTHKNDVRVDRALNSKIGKTSQLKQALDQSITQTNTELNKMYAIKKHLEQEKQKVEKHMQRNAERRAHRSTRPSRELVKDPAQSELKKQTDLLYDTSQKLQSKIDDVSRSIVRLKTIKVNLTADFQDKVKALGLDRDCLDMVANDDTYVAANDLPYNGSTGMPYAWKKSTTQAVDEAHEEHRKASKLRKSAFHMNHALLTKEKKQHDMVQNLLSQRIKDVTSVKEKLHDEMCRVEDEIGKAVKVKKQLEIAIQEKMPPLNLAKQRYMTRTKRPKREAVHDEVEHSLLLQHNELKAVVQDLQKKLQVVVAHLGVLRRNKSELEVNIADKQKSLKVVADM
ncbi:hypothetical protein CYMTET_36974 [Cymbomonas tetramitiformis]|uniref:Tektin n=1 Tax=Cymbomonas tetramitiformis TaxID=36881 RepID=A0AAE0CH31_9CHLO|nr:hypothetical protein CYMTET_36974 [Cymbomonas tetramitiformis]